MACDICGKTGGNLVDLLKTYQTEDIKSICNECERVVNDKHSKLMTFVLNVKKVLLLRFIRNLKDAP